MIEACRFKKTLDGRFLVDLRSSVLEGKLRPTTCDWLKHEFKMYKKPSLPQLCVLEHKNFTSAMCARAQKTHTHLCCVVHACYVGK